MKKRLAVLLAALMLLSLAACGGGNDGKAPSSGDTTPSSQQQEQTTPDPAPVEPDSSADENSGAYEQADTPVPDEGGDPSDLSGYLATKTGQFYSRFSDGRMYMKYEMEMEGQAMTMISATDGDKSYSETQMGGDSMGVSVMIGEEMYTIDHAGKMVIKMSIGANAQSIAGAVLEESDVDMGDLKTGTREIDGKTYDTEEWIVDGAASILCFDGDDLAYMVGVFEGEEMIMKIVETSDKVDDSLFEIPADYTMLEM